MCFSPHLGIGCGGAATQKASSVCCRFSRTCCACFACFLASLSLFSRRKRSISGCSVGASLPPSENGWPSSPSWIITLTSCLGKWLPCRTARSAQSPLAHPNKGGQNQKSKPPLGVTMMPLGAPGISKYGSLVRPDAQIVALCAPCAHTTLKAPPKHGWIDEKEAKRSLGNFKF